MARASKHTERGEKRQLRTLVEQKSVVEVVVVVVVVVVGEAAEDIVG